MAVAAVLVAVLGDRLCRFFDVLPVVAQKDPCFGRLCRYVLTNVVGRKKIRFPIYSFQFYDNEKKIKNESNGMKERAWGHENGFTIGCGVVRLYGTIAVSDDSENLRTCVDKTWQID